MPPVTRHMSLCGKSERHHSWRRRVVSDGPAQIAAAVARHHRHRPHHPAMARTRRGPDCRRPPPERLGVVCGIGQAGAFARTDRVENPQPERGMFSSVVCAANWPGWRKEVSSWAIVLGDQPHLQTETLRALLAFAAQNADAVCQPQFGGRGRHPVILPRTALEALKRTKAENLKDFLKDGFPPTIKCPAADPGLSFDLDTPEDYERIGLTLNQSA